MPWQSKRGHTGVGKQLPKPHTFEELKKSVTMNMGPIRHGNLRFPNIRHPAHLKSNPDVSVVQDMRGKKRKNKKKPRPNHCYTMNDAAAAKVFVLLLQPE